MNRHERKFVFPLLGKDAVIKATVIQEGDKLYISEWQMTTCGDGTYEHFVADALKAIAKKIEATI